MRRSRLMPVFFTCLGSLFFSGCSSQQSASPSITTPVPGPIVEKTIIKPVVTGIENRVNSANETTKSVQEQVSALAEALQKAGEEAAKLPAKTEDSTGITWADQLFAFAKQAQEADKKIAVLKNQLYDFTVQLKDVSDAAEHLASERDQAIKSAQEARDTAMAIKNEATAVKADAQARLDAMKDDRSWWRKYALGTWSVLGLICLAWLGIKLAKSS